MIGRLPEHLADRVRRLNDKDQPTGQGPVVVWLKSSFRVDENPAIDIGRHIAAIYDLPLVIYHGLDERYPFASLRHHNMILDAAVDMWTSALTTAKKKAASSQFKRQHSNTHRSSLFTTKLVCL